MCVFYICINAYVCVDTHTHSHTHTHTHTHIYACRDVCMCEPFLSGPKFCDLFLHTKLWGKKKNYLQSLIYLCSRKEGNSREIFTNFFSWWVWTLSLHRLAHLAESMWMKRKQPLNSSLRFFLHLAGSAIFRALFLCTIFFSFFLNMFKKLFYLITYLFIYFVNSIPCALEPAPFFSECLLVPSKLYKSKCPFTISVFSKKETQSFE